MPIINRQKERKIVEEGRRQGKSDDFIKKAVLRFRFNTDKAETLRETQPVEQKSFASRALQGFSDISGKVLGAATKFTGIQKGVELAAPAAQGFGYLMTFLNGDEETRRRILENPLGDAQKIAQEEGTRAGVRTVAGQALQTAAKVAVFTKGGLGTTGLRGKGLGLTGFVNSFVGRSAEIAFGKAVGEGLEKGEEGTEIIKDAGVKSFLAAATSFVLGSAFNKLFSGFEKKAIKLTGRAFETPIKQIQNDIERGQATINNKILQEGYRGTSETIRKQAVANKKEFGAQIGEIVKKAKGIIFKADVVKDVNKLIEDNVVLEPSQLKLIQRQIAKIPKQMTVQQANNFKRKFASLVPKSAWDNTASSIDTFRAQLFKTLSGGFRSQVEKLAPLSKVINEKWAIASDVLGLIGRKLAKAEVGGGLAEQVRGGPFSVISKAVTSPFTTTVSRTTRAQIRLALSKVSDKKVVRDILKLLIVKIE